MQIPLQPIPGGTRREPCRSSLLKATVVYGNDIQMTRDKDKGRRAMEMQVLSTCVYAIAAIPATEPA